MSRVRPEIAIDDELVAVEPGQMAQTAMTVRNTGSEIAEYVVSMVPGCVPAPWTEAAPSTFRLMPGKEQRVLLRFRPPLDSSTQPGSFPYGVQVTPDEVQHQAQVVGEGDVAVGAVHALEVRLAPRQSRGRWRGKHMVQLLNRGTEDTRVRLRASDEDEALSFALAPATVAVPAGASAEAFLRVRPRSPQIMGKRVDHPFEVHYRRRTDSRTSVTAGLPSSGEIEAQVSGAFIHKPILSPLLLAFLVLAAAVIVLLLMLRPWEQTPERTPPDPPRGVVAFAEGDSVTLGWENSPGFTEIRIREVDCETADAVVPTATGEEVTVQPAAFGRQTHTVGPFELGSRRCYQVRAVASDGASIWEPTPALAVEVGATLQAPEIQASHTGGCTVQVDFDGVEGTGPETLYEVWIGGRAQPDLVAGGGQRYPDQEPGQDVDVFVQTALGDARSEPSNTSTVSVPTDCDLGGNGGGDGGDDGGGTETTVGPATTDLRGVIWLLILPEELDDSIAATWQAIGADVGLGPDQLPEAAVVGEDVSVPDTMADALEGRGIVYVDGYEEEEQARSDCAGLNHRAEETGDPALGLCRLVRIDGSVENVPPASG